MKLRRGLRPLRRISLAIVMLLAVALAATAIFVMPVQAASVTTFDVNGYRLQMAVDADYTEQYYTSAAQRQELENLMNEALNRLNLWNAGEYEKARGLYDYITSNVKYDFNADANDMLQYTAYGAIKRGRAVCQGFSTLYFMMGRKLGLDAPVVIGMTSRGKHAWNLVKIGGVYYGLDAAWDSVYRDYGMSYQCFLKGENSFDDHVLDSEYRSGTFRENKKVSAEDYNPSASGINITIVEDPAPAASSQETATYAPAAAEPVKSAAANVPSEVRESVVIDPIAKFADVSRSAYYSDAVTWALERGITSGISDTQFAPDAPCTRAQMVTFLYSALNRPASNHYAVFTDVPDRVYYREALNWAAERGITSGIGNGLFGGDKVCTRAEALSFLYRAAGSAPVEGNAYSDVAWNAYYRAAVNWGAVNNITSGTGNGTFSPDAPCTRAQIVMFLYRYMNG